MLSACCLRPSMLMARLASSGSSIDSGAPNPAAVLRTLARSLSFKSSSFGVKPSRLTSSVLLSVIRVLPDLVGPPNACLNFVSKRRSSASSSPFGKVPSILIHISGTPIFCRSDVW